MPTATVYSTAGGDGHVYYTSGTFANARAGSSGSATADSSGTRNYAVFVDYSNIALFQYAVGRGYFPFDLSGIPSNATISSATLSVYVYSKSSTDGGNVCVVASTQASGTALSTSDYTAVGSTEYVDRTTGLGGSATTFANITSSAYNTFTLNSSGISALQSAIGGTAKLALRGSKDIDNSAPTGAGSFIAVSYADRTGTSEDPYLTITYSAPAARTTSDSLAWSDSVSRTAPKSRTASDAWAWSDVARLRSSLTTSDAWAWSDSASRLVLRGGDLREPMADVWAWRDTAEVTRTHSGQVTSGRASNDAWAWSDSVSIYGRLRATVTVVPEGANTTLTSYQNPYAGTIAVASTSGFPSSGSAYIIDTTNVLGHYPQAKFEYTSIDATHFYGCTSSSAEFNQTFAYGTSVGTLTNESHFPQIQALDSTSTPELLLTYHQHAAHSAANGTVRGRRSTDGGITWGEEFVIAEAVGRPGGVTGRRPGIYGHTLFQMANGTLFLAWYEHKLDNEDVETYTKYSTDNGVTWSTPIKVPNQYVSSNLMGQSTGCGIIEYGGYLYVMVYGWDGTNYNDRSPDDSYVQLLKTNDLGVTWTNVATVAKGGYNSAPVRGYNETSLVILPDGTWLAQIRAEINSGAGFSSLDRYQSVSTDNGVTWSTPTRVIQKFANTPIVWRMPDGTLLSQGMNQDAGRSVGTGYPITFFTADYNSWPAANYRAESVDATYIALNGSDFANTTTTPATALRATVNAYAVERVSQAGAQVKFQWYNIPGFYLSADAWAWSDSVTRTQTYGRTTSDAWAWNDRQAQTRTTADSWAWNDACATVKTQTKTASDAWAWSDVAVRVNPVATRSTGDTWTWTDAATRTSTRPRTTSDTWAWSDAASAVLGSRPRTTSDSWAWSDTATRTAPRFRSVSEVWAWTDTATGIRTNPRTTSDTWAWSDAASAVLNAAPVAYSRTTSDTWLWVDAATETHGATPLPAAVFCEHYAYPDTNGEHYPFPKVYAKHGPTEGA